MECWSSETVLLVVVGLVRPVDRDVHDGCGPVGLRALRGRCRRPGLGADLTGDPEDAGDDGRHDEEERQAL